MPYEELTKDLKVIFDKFIEKIKSNNLENIILALHTDNKYNIVNNEESHYFTQFFSTFPEELAIKMNAIWTKYIDNSKSKSSLNENEAKKESNY